MLLTLATHYHVFILKIMRKILLMSLLLLPLALFGQSSLPSGYSKVVQTDSLGYQVVSLTAPVLNMRVRETGLSFGSQSSCVLLNSNNEEVFSVPFPPTDEYIELVTDMVMANGGYPVPISRVRAIFKQAEIENKNYDLTQHVPEDDWDY